MNKFWNAPAWSIAKKNQQKRKNTTDGPTPGPGNYSSSNFKGKSPAWKIGNSMRSGLFASNNPGPGSYNISGKNNGPQITLSSKNRLGNLDGYGPGPGNYNPNLNAVLKQSSGCTMGAKYQSNKNMGSLPGPGSYNNAENGFKVGGKIGTSTRGDFGDNTKNPGPGSYDPQSRPYSAGPKYGFGKQLKSHYNNNVDPGPGQYDLNNYIDYGSKSGCTMGYKTKNGFQGTSFTPGPGHYLLNDGAIRPKSGTKIGKAGRNDSKGSIGPGPGAYDQLYRQKIGPTIKMGTSQRTDFNKNQTPGPGSYEALQNKGPGIKISQHLGKHQADITPGPGTYNPDTQGSKARPCSAKIGKGLRSQQANNDTPGPGQYYNQHGQPPKFAYTKQLRSKELKGGDPGPGQYDIQSSVPSAPYYLLDPSIYRSGSKQ